MILPCLILSNIRYVSRVKWRNPGKGVVSSPTPLCSSYWKGNLLFALDYSHQLIHMKMDLALSNLQRLLFYKIQTNKHFLSNPVPFSLILSLLISCIRLLCDWSFRPYHHLIYICYFVASSLFLLCPVNWGCRIHRVYLYRKVRPHQRVSRIWLQTIWWWDSSNAGDLGNAEHLLIAIAPRSTLARSGSTWLGPIYGSNRTKLRTYAKLNYLK